MYVVDIGTVKRDGSGNIDAANSAVAWAEIVGDGKTIKIAITGKSLATGVSTGACPNWQWPAPLVTPSTTGVTLADQIAASLEANRVQRSPRTG